VDIKTKLSVNMVTSVVLVSILLCSVLITYSIVEKQEAQHQEAMDVQTAVFELNILLNDYLLNREERAIRQWEARYNSGLLLLQKIIEREKTNQETAKNMLSEYIALEEAFKGEVENYEHEQKIIKEGGSEDELFLVRVLQGRKISQLLITSQLITSSANMLEDETHSHLNSVRAINRNLVLLISVLLLASILLVSIRLLRDISKPLSKLRNAAIEIGKGKLDTRVEVESEDEIGDLGNIINEMATRLKESLTRLKKSELTLRERVKELGGIYETSKIMGGIDDINEALPKVVEIVSAAHQYPEIACARITYNGKEYQTDNYKPTEWGQLQPIQIGEKKLGEIEVYYSEDKPFLVEEQALLKEIAAQISQISERKRSEKALKTSEEKFRNLIEKSPIGFIISTPEGVLMDMNTRALEIFGYTSKEEARKTPLPAHYRNPEDRQRFLEAFAKGPVRNFEAEFKRSDNTTFWASVSSIKQTTNEETLLINVIQDVTKRREAEKRVRELDTVKNKFITVVSHQMLTPLSAIRWSLETLIGGTLGKVTPDQENVLRDAHKADTEIIDRIGDLVATMDIEQKKVRLELQKINPHSLIDSLFIEYAPEIKIKKLKTMFNKQTGDIKLNADPAILKQALAKIFDNAVKYNREGGEITLTSEMKDNEFILTISDTGIGIPTTDQDKIFTKFYRASNAYTEVQDASGLGLFIAKSLVEAHGGKIWFNSREGEGSNFYISLPITN
jgi:PAS domain S-box-containing protein